jgi:hypothetical protein
MERAVLSKGNHFVHPLAHSHGLDLQCKAKRDSGLASVYKMQSDGATKSYIWSKNDEVSPLHLIRQYYLPYVLSSSNRVTAKPRIKRNSYEDRTTRGAGVEIRESNED